MNQRGSTFTEVLVVSTIIGIISVSAAFSYSGWLKRYKIEKAALELYADIMNARMKAMQTKVEHYVIPGSYSYSIVEDSNGNGRYDSGDKVSESMSRTLEYQLSWNGNGKITLGTRGIMSNLGTLRLKTGENPDLDCIKISMTRIAAGKYENSSCTID